ncbi:MAG: hypothetical protein DWQ47_04700 [Acidobacteria bacterium]|mgnify:CR=1 FL=1|nr:MAG: hypothetical protein DWQ32_08250 [Acidobacteriota bacterium]REK01685.1 MAG: hypothetical protein DWQ38_04685 [Acidobacteriota bacterium]REK14641.1 MAG: hypothetical protein DWQ43_13940 [Acidobacteriota bacterium]REK45356.1 MAG: hypothetical protein DWQ47_04700 [Acidobacteriota bacterium]
MLMMMGLVLWDERADGKQRSWWRYDLTYGIRVNVEAIFLDSADQEWEQAKRHLSSGEYVDEESGELRNARLPDSRESFGYSIRAVVGWAICLEAFMNLAWNNSEEERLPEKYRHESALKELRTKDKIRTILKAYDYDLGQLTWLDDLYKLIKLRNRIVHFKDEVAYVGYEFAPPFSLEFEESRMISFRNALGEIIASLDSRLNLKTGLPDGKAEWVTEL